MKIIQLIGGGGGDKDPILKNDDSVSSVRLTEPKCEMLSLGCLPPT